MVLTVVEAGRLGGQAVSRKRGREFYRRIGQQGQAALRQKHPGMARTWGSMGGRPRKPTLAEIMGEAGNKLKEVVAGSPSTIPGSPRPEVYPSTQSQLNANLSSEIKPPKELMGVRNGKKEAYTSDKGD